MIGTPGGLRWRARQDGGLADANPATARADHSPHRIGDPDELAAHLAAQHGYTRDMIEGASRTFLDTVDVRAHHRMTESPPPTAEALAETAERLSSGALDTLEALRSLDRDLALRLADRWSVALHALTGGA